MKDPILIRYLIGKYCIRWKVIVPTTVIFLIELFYSFIPTLVILFILLIVAKLISGKSLKGVLSIYSSGIYFISLFELVFPIMLLCDLLEKLQNLL